MKACHTKLLAILLWLVGMTVWSFFTPLYSLAENPRPSRESLSFDPKKTDDLLKKIDQINKSYVYRKGGRRDPFIPLLKPRDLLERELLAREGSWELLCDPNYDSRKPITKFELNALELKGVVWGGMGIQALINAPDGKAYNVKVGNFLGKNCGKIIKITNKYLKIEERYSNPQGRVRIDYKYKVLTRKERAGIGEKGKAGKPTEMEPGSPTESVTVDIDAEENTLVAKNGDVKKLIAGDDEALTKVKTLILKSGDYEAVIVGGAFNIDLPRTTRFKGQVGVFIPKIGSQHQQMLELGVDTEFTTLDLAEIANLGQTVRFTLKTRTPVYLFLNGPGYNTSGVASVTISRLLTVEEVQAARRAAITKRKAVERSRAEEGKRAKEKTGPVKE